MLNEKDVKQVTFRYPSYEDKDYLEKIVSIKKPDYSFAKSGNENSSLTLVPAVCQARHCHRKLLLYAFTMKKVFYSLLPHLISVYFTSTLILF